MPIARGLSKCSTISTHLNSVFTGLEKMRPWLHDQASTRRMWDAEFPHDFYVYLSQQTDIQRFMYDLKGLNIW